MKLKKIILLITLVLMIVAAIVTIIFVSSKKDTSNTTETTANKIDLEIKDSYFLANMDDIYINYNNYEGKTVSYEGFVYYDPYYNGAMVVARYFYCCGYDAYITGLECDYTGDKPSANQWVKVTGVIQINRENPDDIYPYLKVTSMELLEKEGEKYVTS